MSRLFLCNFQKFNRSFVYKFLIIFRWDLREIEGKHSIRLRQHLIKKIHMNSWPKTNNSHVLYRYMLYGKCPHIHRHFGIVKDRWMKKKHTRVSQNTLKGWTGQIWEKKIKDKKSKIRDWEGCIRHCLLRGIAKIFS